MSNEVKSTQYLAGKIEKVNIINNMPVQDGSISNGGISGEDYTEFKNAESRSAENAADIADLNNKFLFSNGEWVDGSYVNCNTGGIYEQSGYSRTNHISIPKGISKIKVYSKCEIGDYSGIAFYKSDVFISGVKITGTNPVSMTITEVNIPNGAETFRYSCYTNAKNNAYVSIDSNIVSMVSNIDNQIDSVNNKFDFMLIDTIDKPMVFANKNIIGFGDSIMAGYNELGVIVENNWVNLFKEKSGATNFTNRAIGGAGFAVTGNTIASQVTGQILDTRDYIFVGAGTNDYHYSISKENFISGITSAFDIIDANKGGQTKVIVITPINRTKGTPNNNPIPLDWYRETITMYALRRGYSVIDGSKIGFTSVAGTYQQATMVDGLHPNEVGYEIYARHLYGILL